MSSWEMHPEEVQTTLENTQSQAQDVAGKLSESVFTGLQTDLATMEGDAPLNGVTGQVPQAVSNLMTDQQADLKSIFTTIEAAIWGAIAVGQELQKADGDMAAQAVAAAQEAGLDGDMAAFQPYGWQAPQPQSAPASGGATDGSTNTSSAPGGPQGMSAV